MTLSDRLQALRKSQNLSQEQLAEKLDVSRQAISKWESGQELDNQIVYKDHIVYKEKRGFNKIHDLPASIRVALAILIIAFGVFVVVPILFVISMELLGSIF